jgi:hypothetical protein
VSDAFQFNPYAQDDGRIDLGVDLREGTIPAGARAVVQPDPQPEPEQDDVPGPAEPEPTGEQPGPGAAAGGDPAEQPQPETKVLTRGGKQTQPRTGPKPRAK